MVSASAANVVSAFFRCPMLSLYAIIAGTFQQNYSAAFQSTSIVPHYSEVFNNRPSQIWTTFV